MEISLAELRVLELKFMSADYGEPDPSEEAVRKKDGYQMGFDVVRRPGTQREFSVIFNCRVYAEELRHLELAYLARFDTTEDVDENFMKSHFVGMNAPAISYPYMRAFVGQMLLISGYKPITLPTINFQEIFKRKQLEATTAGA
jgi:preprotein translocase subunit SecB